MVLTAAQQPAGWGMPPAAEAVRRWWLRVGGRRVRSVQIGRSCQIERASEIEPRFGIEPSFAIEPSFEFEPEAVARILAAVARECRSYTDPRADYPLAETARAAQLFGAGQRRAVMPSPSSTV